MPLVAPTPPSKATDRGHTPVWDPPHPLSNARRWTCPCGDAVIEYRSNVYGSATERDCPRRKEA